MPRGTWAISAVLGVLLFTSMSRAQKVDELLKFLPDSVNAVAVVNIKGLMESPRGKKEDWAKKHESEFLAGAVHLPPSIQQYVTAKEIRANGFSMSPTFGLARLPRKFDAVELAKRERGEVETIGDQRVVFSPRRGYFAELSPGILGAISPAERQDISRWLRMARNANQPVISDYLQKALKEESTAQVRVALDLRDLMDPKLIHMFVATSKAMKGDKKNIEIVEKLLGELRGARVAIEVENNTKASIRLDFGVEVKNEALLKPMLVELMDELGAQIDEFKDAKFRADGNSFIVEVEKLSDQSLRKILSLVYLPHPDTTEEGATDPKLPQATRELEATKRYFQSVQSQLTELRRGDARSTDFRTSSLWFETYARRIDQLPILDVDSEMLQWGSSVAAKLRAMSAALRGVPITVQNLNSYIQHSTTVQPASGGHSWYGAFYNAGSVFTDTNLFDVRSAQTQAINATRLDREKIWLILDEDETRIRRAMTKRFRVEF